VGRRAAALRDLCLRWRPGERLLLLGPSGGGKSTLALCLNGIIPHSQEAHWEAGRVLVDGQDTRALGPAALARRVGVLFQDPEAQLVMLEVDDEIAFGLENLGLPRSEMIARVAAAREVVGLDPHRTPRALAELSGGAKQRVALASLLAMSLHEGGALALDEPTANLDPHGARQVLGAVRRLAQDRSRSLLLVEHRLDGLGDLVDRVVVLDGEGRAALDGSPEEVFLRSAQTLEELGVWTPGLADLALLLHPDADRLPADARDAARLIAARWPDAPSPSDRAQPDPGPARNGTGTHEGATSLLALEQVTYAYPRSPVPAVREVSVRIERGGLVALVGANAAGKSTLGLLLAGVIRPTAGRVTLDGRDLRAVPEATTRDRVAYVFQYPEHQFVASTVRDELAFGLRVRGRAGADAGRRVDAALERFGLAMLAEANPYTLSHGQKRRLSVATAVVTDPEVVILDEPTFGQDRRHTEELMAALRELHREGRTVIAITHDMDLVAEHALRVVAMSAGQVLFDGVPRALFARPDVLDRCGLLAPPVAEAFALARELRPDLPTIISISEARAALRRRP
jgi:energy-coupling factor transport system ATP-binding protein